MRNVNSLSVIGFICTALVLTACQSQALSPKDKMPSMQHQDCEHRCMMRDGHHDEAKKRNLSAENKAQLEQMRAKHEATRKALNQACQNKAGQTVSVKLDDKTVSGTCEVRFIPNRPHKTADDMPQPMDTATPDTP